MVLTWSMKPIDALVLSQLELMMEGRWRETHKDFIGNTKKRFDCSKFD